MRATATNALLQSRAEAGRLLSKRLSTQINHDAVVVGIPHGGVGVAHAIAEELSLPMEVMPCRKIKDPSNDKTCIGSVSADDVFIHDCAHTIPQDYIYHQIALLRNAIRYENKQYYGSEAAGSFRYKTVILVDDVLVCSDSIIACLRGIKKQKPLKVIVAVPVVSAESARLISAEADDFVFLRMEPSIDSPKDYFVEFLKVDEENVKTLLKNAKKNHSTI